MANLTLRHLFLPLVVAAAVYGAWGAMSGGGWVSDDWPWLERAGSGEIQRPGKFFRPGCWMTWRLLSPKGPGAAHVFDLVVHWFCVWQVSLLAWKLSGRSMAGFVAGVLFATLPTLHEAVCWSSARCGPLAVGFALAGINAVLRDQRLIAGLLLIAALSMKEPAVFFIWGLPLLLLCLGRRRDALVWSVILAVFSVAYVGALRAAGAHVGLAGGYAAPFDLGRSLSHLGSYLGLGIGVHGTSNLWPLWFLLGLGALGMAARGSPIFLALWLWECIIFLPFLKLGGPEQTRFLYPLSIVPVVFLAIQLAAVAERRRILSRAVIIGTACLVVFLSIGARRVSHDWVASAARARSIIGETRNVLSTEHPHILVDPPEWHGKAHLFRNGLFEALRLITEEHGYRGILIPPSERVLTAGELARWLEQRAPQLLHDQHVAAWLYCDDRPVQLNGWRVPENARRPLTALLLRDGEGDPGSKVSSMGEQA